MTIPKKSDLRSRLTKGLGAQGYSQAVHILIRLVEVPLLLSCWGAQLYGEWLMLAAIPMYLSMCDGGFAGAACREMSIRSGAGDRAGALSVFQSTWVLLLLVSLCVGMLAFLVVPVVPLSDWLGFKEMGSNTAKLSAIILVAYVLTGFQTGLVNGGFWCDGRYAEGMVLSATVQLMEFGGLSAAVFWGGGPVSAACGYLGGRLAGLALMRLGLYRATPWLRYGWHAATVAEIKHLSAPAFASLAFPLGNALNIQGIVLVVGLLLGPSSVVAVSVLRTLSRFAMQPAAIISRIIEPEMAIAYGGDRKKDFRRLFNRSCQASLWLGAVFCLLLAVSGEWLLGLWTHGKVAMYWPLYLFLLLAVVVNSIWYVALMAAYATNRHVKIAMVYSVVYGGLTFVFAILLLNKLGITGAGVAVFLSESIMAAYALPKMLSLAGESFSSWVAGIAKPPWFLIRANRDMKKA